MAAEYRTRALVLRTFEHGESDRLVHLYSERLGRVSAIAKGARRSRRRFPGTLEIFSAVEAHLVDPPRASLMRLEGARVVLSLEPLTHDLGRYAIGCLLLELLDRLTGEREASPELFEFALGSLQVVAGETPDRLLGLLVLAKTLARLGFRPELGRCASCGAALRGRVGFAARPGGAVCGRCAPEPERRVRSELLAALDRGLRTPLRRRGELGLSDADVALAEQLLERFFRFHIGFELRTAPFLQQALGARVDCRQDGGDTPPAHAGSPSTS
jgi:DNA repair protein RecO (recombination protein O)